MRTKFQKFKESYFLYSFKRDKVAIFSFIVLTIFLLLALASQLKMLHGEFRERATTAFC